MRTRVYIASPYSIGDKLGNVKYSIEVADRLMTLGFAPYVPLLTHYQDELCPRPYQEWLEVDKVWVLACDIMLRLPGQSNGADTEVAHAMLWGIPVVYSIEELMRKVLPIFGERAAERAAIRTLQSLGYTYHGGERWQPPLGPRPDWAHIDAS